MNENLKDIAAERAVLAGICQQGKDVYLDVKDILTDGCFDHKNGIIFNSLEMAFAANIDRKIDFPTIFSFAKELGLLAELQEHANYVKGLFSFHIETSNVQEFAKKIRKLYEIKNLISCHHETISQLNELTGGESIIDIASISEKTVFGFTNKLIGGSDQIASFGEGILEYVDEVINTPLECIGIPIPFTRYAQAVGGIKSGIHLIAARSKVGKSTHALNIALHVGIKEKIPVCYLDSEMDKRSGNWARALARVSGVPFNKINDHMLTEEADIRKVQKAARIINSSKIDFINIAAIDFDCVISLVQKWAYQKTDRLSNKSFSDALLIYDYIKMTDYNDLRTMKEYEIIGQRMSQLHNLTIKYKLPTIAYVQLNKQMEVSQSDRLNWFCTSNASLEKKTEEEMADCRQLGNRKLRIQAARFGEEMSDANYINYSLDGKISTFSESSTYHEWVKEAIFNKTTQNAQTPTTPPTSPTPPEPPQTD